MAEMEGALGLGFTNSHFKDVGTEAWRGFQVIEPSQQVGSGPGFEPESLIQELLLPHGGPYAQLWGFEAAK